MFEYYDPKREELPQFFNQDIHRKFENTMRKVESLQSLLEEISMEEIFEDLIIDAEYKFEKYGPCCYECGYNPYYSGCYEAQELAKEAMNSKAIYEAYVQRAQFLANKLEDEMDIAMVELEKAMTKMKQAKAISKRCR
ncbi:hypothetical protein AN639_08810 [Candidatus Epulonipiscium fishelsonii]|uniref:Uncharacterized protein n=1 Tax=Candidatus Epulonipiscium fishelsonii TaxID=77094 RepID=A0ACC8XFH7_9FIRM|nr:hypothetical protein AN639_08810 [Epulopiscium sp. SCG-B05WGA-EpuloA1]ONI41943.1 hypothetical protein AN396_02580 [Epulopiscium sp. SCG-B11WGA-EpuloA1]ONI47126.1 hypothetical protein AN644_01445 [Epulopiscium sp. SCG-C06WGA-EpuloA1]